MKRLLTAFCFFLVSVTYTIGWTTISSELAYFKRLFGPGALLQLNLAYFLPSIPILLAQTWFDEHFDAKFGAARATAFRFSFGFGGVLGVSLAYPLLPERLAPILVSCALLGLASGVLFGSSYQLVSRFPPENTVALTLGYVASGPLVLLLNFEYGIGPHPSNAQRWALFASISGITLAGLAAALCIFYCHWDMMDGRDHAHHHYAEVQGGGGGGGRRPASRHGRRPKADDSPEATPLVGAGGWNSVDSDDDEESSVGAVGSTITLSGCQVAGADQLQQRGGKQQQQQALQQDVPPLPRNGRHRHYRNGDAALSPSSTDGEEPSDGSEGGDGAPASTSLSSPWCPAWSPANGQAPPYNAHATKEPPPLLPPPSSASARGGGGRGGSSGYGAGTGGGARGGGRGDGNGGGGGGTPDGVGLLGAALDLPRQDSEAARKQLGPSLLCPAAGGVRIGNAALLRLVWPAALSLGASISTSVLLFPFFTYVPTCGRMQETLPQRLFAARVIADIVGRLLPKRLLTRSTAALLLLSGLKTVMTPLFFMYIDGPGLAGVKDDRLAVGFVAVFWWLSGYLNTCAYVAAPTYVPPWLGPRAGALMALVFQLSSLGALMVAQLVQALHYQPTATR